MSQTTRVDLSSRFPGRLVVTVPEAGQVLEQGRTRSYELARAGLIPTIRLGPSRLVVPVAQLEALLAGEWKPEADDAA